MNENEHINKTSQNSEVAALGRFSVDSVKQLDPGGSKTSLVTFHRPVPPESIKRCLSVCCKRARARV